MLAADMSCQKSKTDTGVAVPRIRHLLRAKSSVAYAACCQLKANLRMVFVFKRLGIVARGQLLALKVCLLGL